MVFAISYRAASVVCASQISFQKGGGSDELRRMSKEGSGEEEQDDQEKEVEGCTNRPL